MYVLDRMEIGQVRVSTNVAVADTVLYGRVVSPIQTEGKIVVQQYLVREEGKWRVATGDKRYDQKISGRQSGFWSQISDSSAANLHQAERELD